MKNLNKRIKYILCALVMVLLITSCADVSPNVQDCVTSDAYGFWGGLWHGIIVIFSFIGSLFSDDIAIYAYNNNGGWYDFGFVLGAIIIVKGTKVTIKL